jgi:(p)ppGpp synthase/HD superfamily hydrolase
MLSFSEPVDQMAAVLHDVIEDTLFTIDDLVEARYPDPVVAAVDCLTHRDDEMYEQYIDRVARDDVARRVKIVDLNENLANNRRLPRDPGNTERIERYRWALERLGAPALAGSEPEQADGVGHRLEFDDDW